MFDEPVVDPSIELKGGEKLGHVTEPWHSLSQEFGNFPLSVDAYLRELRREVSEELLREVRSVKPDFKTRWTNACHVVTEKLNKRSLQTGGPM